jgi:uncharacterized protein
MSSSSERLENTVDPKLLGILVCPLTKGPLEFDAAKQELISRSAKLAYPIRDGIPIMLHLDLDVLLDRHVSPPGAMLESVTRWHQRQLQTGGRLALCSVRSRPILRFHDRSLRRGNQRVARGRPCRASALENPHVRKTHISEDLSAKGRLSPTTASQDDLLRAILKRRVTPRQLRIGPDVEITS